MFFYNDPGNGDASDPVGSGGASSSLSSYGSSPYDSCNNDGDDGDACLEDLQQGFPRKPAPHDRRDRTPSKALFGDRHNHYDHGNSDSTDDDPRSRRRLGRTMASGSSGLPLRNPREKHRSRRTRSSARRSGSHRSPEGSGEAPEGTPVSVRRRPSQPQGSSSSSHKRRSSLLRPLPHHFRSASDHSSQECSSGSSPDSSPTRGFVEEPTGRHHRVPSLGGASRSGSVSPTSGNRPYQSFLGASGASVSKSPSANKLGGPKQRFPGSAPKSLCLLATLAGMVLLSVSGMVALTYRAVPTFDRAEDFVPTLPDRADDSGLRGKKVLGRMWDTSGSNLYETANATSPLPSSGGTLPPNQKTGSGKHRKGARAKREGRPRDGATVLPKRLQMRMPPSLSEQPEPGFDRVDPRLYPDSLGPNTGASQDFPRIVVVDPRIAQPRAARTIETYPADVTDNTQLYGILPSDDERLSKMERRDPYRTDECVPMQDWQTAYQPSCNGMHELALQTLGASPGRDGEAQKPNTGKRGLDASLFGTKGFWRYAWKLVIDHYDGGEAEEDTVVFKNLKYGHDFEDAHFEHDRIDAIAMERLTSSPHVINIFGFCGHSVLTEYADGKRLGELADKSKKKPLKRLEIARDIANGLADVHGIDGDGNATFVHLDVNPANVVSVRGTLKLNDFNIGIVRRWNTTSNEACGFPAQYPNPQWRSPEEARNEQHLTEKVDIFSLGHIFFRLICGHEPWNKLEPGGRPSKEEVNEKVQRGDLPFIPEDVVRSDNPEVVAIRDAMLQCYRFDPKKRPSARDIANGLDRNLKELQQKYAKSLANRKKKPKTKKKPK